MPAYDPKHIRFRDSLVVRTGMAARAAQHMDDALAKQDIDRAIEAAEQTREHLQKALSALEHFVKSHVVNR